MTSKKSQLSRWLRAVPQITTFFGLATIALIWGAVEFHLNIERVQSEAAAFQNTSNLARVFEEQIVRTIKVNDRILRSLQLSSVNGTLLADFDRWTNEIDGSTDLTVQLSLVDAQGLLIASNIGPVLEVTDRSEREYFKVHRGSAEAGLFISEPIFGRVSGKWLIQLTRALRGRHGAFAGVAVASLSPAKLAKFYESVNLGPDGAISLVGLDGVVRASAGLKVDSIGRSMIGSELLRRAAIADEGFFTSRGTIDGITRLTSYRVVEGYPLALFVARAEHDVFRDYWRNRYSYRLAASGLTLFILIVMSINIRHRERLVGTREALRASESLAREKSRELELTLDHMSQGIMMIDADQNVAVVNRRAVDTAQFTGICSFAAEVRRRHRRISWHKMSSARTTRRLPRSFGKPLRSETATGPIPISERVPTASRSRFAPPRCPLVVWCGHSPTSPQASASSVRSPTWRITMR